jgi:single-strand DNA-binding protein
VVEKTVSFLPQEDGMANGINKVTLIGNLGTDPEMKYTQDGTPVANFSVAINESWTGQDGQKHEKVEWARVVAWRKLAEAVGKYLHKGSKVYVEGKLQTRSWDDQNGQKRYTTEVVASTALFLDPPGDRKPEADYSREAGAPIGDPPPASAGELDDDGPLPF